MLKNRKIGFWLASVGGAVALCGSIAYLIAYALTADPVTGEWDRVFKWLVFGLVAAGGVIGIAGEFFRMPFTPICASACISVALAAHLVETAYPLADVLTRVPFFGGNPTLAIIFAVIFAVAALLTVVAAFMEHNKK
jgi:hypothetical protein